MYNGLVQKDENVFGAWAQVDSNYQRRSDLIPNLVKTVSAFMEHEHTTLQGVAEARSGKQQNLKALLEELIKTQSASEQFMQGKMGGKPSSELFLRTFEQAQAKTEGVMTRLLATVEAYPVLRSSDQMIALQAQLEGTENRINIARFNYNREVKEFNTTIRMFPGRFLASACDFQRKAYFKPDSEAKERVELDFK